MTHEAQTLNMCLFIIMKTSLIKIKTHQSLNACMNRYYPLIYFQWLNFAVLYHANDGHYPPPPTHPLPPTTEAPESSAGGPEQCSPSRLRPSVAPSPRLTQSIQPMVMQTKSPLRNLRSSLSQRPTLSQPNQPSNLAATKRVRSGSLLVAITSCNNKSDSRLRHEVSAEIQICFLQIPPAWAAHWSSLLPEVTV